MNTRTGELFRATEEELKEWLSQDDHITAIKEEEMTEKQRLNMQVSKHDNRSKLGKKFTESRKEERKRVFGK